MKKTVVEDCLSISISELLQERAIVPGELRRGTYKWWIEGRPPHATLNYEAVLRDLDHASLRIEYTTGGKYIEQWLWLKRTIPNYGGRRWWFRCPVLNIRVAKLYLPPGGDRFASRKAWDLTYRSCQESHKSERFYRGLAREFGKDEEWVRAMLERGDRARYHGRQRVT